MTRMRAIGLSLMIALLAPVGGRAVIYETYQGQVVGVRDGDTIRVMRYGREINVRLNGIDAPERSQAFGSRARKFTLAACSGRTVTVKEVAMDRYGRVVADVRLPDGTSLNQAIVRAGFAWWYRTYSTDETLQRLEAEARTAKRGLWADKDPLPPWEFRRRRAAPAAVKARRSRD